MTGVVVAALVGLVGWIYERTRLGGTDAEGLARVQNELSEIRTHLPRARRGPAS
jgi:hypothetical protein